MKTYEHLRQVIDSYLDEELMKKNCDSTRRQLQTGHSKMLLTGNSSTEHAPALSASPARRPNSKHRQNASSAARIDDAPAAVAKSKGKGKQRTRSPSPNKLTPEASKLAREQKVCYQYVLGVCSKGDDCKYSHGELDGLTGPATTPREQNPHSAAEKKRIMCRFYKTGCCQKGEKCEYKHAGAASIVPSGTGRCGSASSEDELWTLLHEQAGEECVQRRCGDLR